MSAENIAERWADFRPIKPSDVECAFGSHGDSFTRFAPMYDGYHKNSVPREFAGRRFWECVVSQWFFGGLCSDDHFEPKSGIDANVALKHVGVVMRSFEPDHGSKEKIAAYLLSLWFDDFRPSAGSNERFLAKLKSSRSAPLGSPLSTEDV